MNSTDLIQDGRFVAVSLLATGGAASVWSAIDREVDRCVVLKVAHEPEPQGWGHSLWREYEALVRLRSPRLTTVRGRGRSRRGPLPADRPYLVLDRIRALPLGGRQRSLPTMTRLAAGLGRALADIHDRGWLHRDIKPSNVLWDARRLAAPVLIDLGLAVKIGHRPAPGRICGSLPYVAPEAIFGEPLDERTDLYAFGQLLWRAWTGRAPRRETTAEGWLRWHVVGKNVEAGRIRSGLPPLWRWTIRRLVERDARDRPMDIREALRPLGLAPAAPQPTPASDWPKIRRCLDRAAAGFPSIVWTPDVDWPEGLDAREWQLWAAGREIAWQRISNGTESFARSWTKAIERLDANDLLISAPTSALNDRESRCLASRLTARLTCSKRYGLLLLHGPLPKKWPKALKGVLQNLRKPEPGTGEAAEAG